jgi:hypothetical protein
MPLDFNWLPKTLTQLEGEDWGPPTYGSYVVINCHQLRHKPLKEFTAEDLRLMLGQHVSLSLLMPMAIDLLQVDPFAAGGMFPGALLGMALKVDREFWREHPSLWHRMNTVLVDLHSFHELMESELLPAAAAFDKHRPADSQ